MPKRPKGNVPPEYPPPRDPNLRYPPQEDLYQEYYPSEDPYYGYPSGGLRHPAYSPQPYATGHHHQPYDTGRHPQSSSTRPPAQQYPPEPHALVHSSRRPAQFRSSFKHSEGTPHDLAGAEPRHRRGESSGATNRPTDSNRRSDRLGEERDLTFARRRQPDSGRHSDSEPESEQLTVATRGDTTVARRRHADSERDYDRQAESEQSTVARRGDITVDTHHHTDSKRPSNKPSHSGKGRKSTNTKASTTRISVRPGRLDVDPGDGNFDVKFQNDVKGYNFTMTNQDGKGTGGRSKGKATESSRNNRNTGRSRTQAVEPSRDDQNTQPTVAEEEAEEDYYALIGCTIDASAATIMQKVMEKEAELLSRRTGRMSKQEKKKLDEESDLLEQAFDVLDNEERRSDYDQMWLLVYGNRGSRGSR